MTALPDHPAPSPLAASGFVAVARRADVPPGGLLGVTTPDGTPVCLADLDGELHALHDVCSHQAFPLSAGEIAPDGTVECSWHGARFDPRTGMPRRGPACECVRTYEVRVEGEMVYVRTAREAGKQGSRETES
ncbi:MAG TPA: non-heme iron oxygenase ferredoxin subunit [Gemmatimonadales bacterium]